MVDRRSYVVAQASPKGTSGDLLPKAIQVLGKLIENRSVTRESLAARLGVVANRCHAERDEPRPALGYGDR